MRTPGDVRRSRDGDKTGLAESACRNAVLDATAPSLFPLRFLEMFAHSVHTHETGSTEHADPQTHPDGTTLRRFRCHVMVHDESAGGLLAFVFLIHTCRVMLDVSPTLTTSTLDASRLGWFEACS